MRPEEPPGMSQDDRSAGAPRTLFDRIWDRHRVLEREDGQTLLYVDRHLVHDGAAPAFETLRRRGLKPRAPERIFATPDHYVPTDTRELSEIPDPERRGMVEDLNANAAKHGFRLFGLTDPNQGIVHVIGPETGLSQPGMVIVCADSHTSTHGALGALAFGIGMTETAHVLATQTLWQRRPRTMRIRVDGALGAGVTAKDVILAIIARIGTAGATEHVIEYAGAAIRGLSMEGRLTLCNMSIEAGGRAGMVAPDDTTIDYLAGRAFAPGGAAWDAAVARWRALPSDPDAVFDTEVSLDGAAIAPMVTWGNSPEDALPVDARVPDPAAETDPDRRASRARARLHGPDARHAAHGDCRRSRLHRQLHQWPHRGFPRRGLRREGPQGGAGRAGLGGAGLRAREAPGGSRGTRPHLQGRRLRLAGGRLFHVPRHQWRDRRTGAARRVHVEQEFPRAAGAGHAHASHEPRHGGRRGRHRPHRRCAAPDGRRGLTQ